MLSYVSGCEWKLRKLGQSRWQTENALSFPNADSPTVDAAYFYFGCSHVIQNHLHWSKPTERLLLKDNFLVSACLGALRENKDDIKNGHLL